LVAVTRALSELLKLGFVLWLVRGPGDVMRVPVVYVAGDAFTALVLGLGLRKRGFHFRVWFDRTLALPVLRRALPLMVTPLLGLVIYNADVIVIRVMRGREEAGWYLAAYVLVGYLGIFGNVMKTALVPVFTRQRLAPERQRELFDGSVTGALALGLPLAVGGAWLSVQLVTFAFGEAFEQSAAAMAVLLYSVPMQFVRSVVQATLIAHEHRSAVLRITAWTAAISVGAALLVVPTWGMSGAAIVAVASEFCRLLLSVRYAWGVGLIFTRLARMIPPVASTMVMTAVLAWVRPTSLWQGIAVGAIAYTVTLSFFIVSRRRRSLSLL
jgi:O-antigen/teichoic acid export membrane protein